MLEIIGIISMVLAVAGVVLNNRLNRLCFWLWIVSNGLSAYLHFDAGIWSLLVRDMVFLGLSIEGLFLWRKKSKNLRFEISETND